MMIILIFKFLSIILLLIALLAIYSDFFYQCKNHKSILSALKMECFLESYQQIHTKYSLNAMQDVKRLLDERNFNFILSEIQISEFNVSKFFFNLNELLYKL